MAVKFFSFKSFLRLYLDPRSLSTLFFGFHLFSSILHRIFMGSLQVSTYIDKPVRSGGPGKGVVDAIDEGAQSAVEGLRLLDIGEMGSLLQDDHLRTVDHAVEHR